MRFLVDECTGPGVAQRLVELGHEVFSVFDHARGATDDEILNKAYQEKWILITNDKDFGEKVFRDLRQHHGVIFLRLQDERTLSKIGAIEKLLAVYEDQLMDAYVVVTESLVRFGHP